VHPVTLLVDTLSAKKASGTWGAKFLFISTNFHQTLSDGEVSSLHYSIGLFCCKGISGLGNSICLRSSLNAPSTSVHYQWLLEWPLHIGRRFVPKKEAMMLHIWPECSSSAAKERSSLAATITLNPPLVGMFMTSTYIFEKIVAGVETVIGILYFSSISNLARVAGGNMVEHISSEMRPVESASNVSKYFVLLCVPILHEPVWELLFSFLI